MFETHLECLGCNKKIKITDKYICDICGCSLDVKYDYEKIKSRNLEEILPKPGYNIWRYKYLLPVSDEKSIVTLYEGGTPLIKSNNLSKEIGLENLFFKDETRNPSGSFKDRPIAVGVSKSIELCFRTVVAASSGNAAASLATYASKANLDCYIFVPEGTPVGKVSQAITNGARVIKVRGDYSNSYKIAKMASSKFLWMNITTTFLNPYTLEGDKTVAYEIYHQTDGVLPNWILVPTGAGPLVYGIYKGFSELKMFGLIKKIPKMVAVQAEGCKPIVRAFENNENKIKAWKNIDTIASAIADPLRGYEKDGEIVLKVIRDSNGFALSVSDEEIKDAVKELARREGIYVEPAAAVSFAGLKNLIKINKIRKDEKIVCVVTGHGLKDPNSAVKDVKIPLIEPKLKEVEKILN